MHPSSENGVGGGRGRRAPNGATSPAQHPSDCCLVTIGCVSSSQWVTDVWELWAKPSVGTSSDLEAVGQGPCAHSLSSHLSPCALNCGCSLILQLLKHGGEGRELPSQTAVEGEDTPSASCPDSGPCQGAALRTPDQVRAELPPRRLLCSPRLLLAVPETRGATLTAPPRTPTPHCLQKGGSLLQMHPQSTPSRKSSHLSSHGAPQWPRVQAGSCSGCGDKGLLPPGAE